MAQTLPQHTPRGLHRDPLEVSQYPRISFASAHASRIASIYAMLNDMSAKLCLSTRLADCIGKNSQIFSAEIGQCAVGR